MAMMKKIHIIKLRDTFADEVLSGEKSFEIRYNDRGYQKGDLVKFTAVHGEGGLATKIPHPINDVTFEITYVFSGFGIKESYVVFGIKKIENEESSEETEDTREGCWVYTGQKDEFGYKKYFECSLCGCLHLGFEENLSKHCPHCGHEMTLISVPSK